MASSDEPFNHLKLVTPSVPVQGNSSDKGLNDQILNKELMMNPLASFFASEANSGE